MSNKPIRDELEARQANEVAGYTWFSPATKRFFGTRISDASFTVVEGGSLFISSERNDMSDWPREYTLRFIFSEGPRRGQVETIGQFQEHSTMARATAHLKAVAREWPGIMALQS